MEHLPEDNDKPRTSLRRFAIFIAGALLIQATTGFIIYRRFDSWGDRGTFGDMFGAVNTLFSGLALAGIIYAMLMQREELELQRRDTRLNTLELSRAAQAEEKAATALASQADALKQSFVEATRARSATVFFELQPQLTELRPKWHELYKFPADHNTWTDQQRILADHVGTELQRVAYVCVSGFIDATYIMEGYAKVFVQCWDKLEPYVRDYRISCGEPPDLTSGTYQQRMHLEMFVRKCHKFLDYKPNFA